MQQDEEESEQRKAEEHHDGHAEPPAVGDFLHERRHRGDRPRGEDERDPLQHDAGPEGGDEGVDPSADHEQAVHQADDEARREHRGEARWAVDPPVAPKTLIPMTPTIGPSRR